MISIQKQQRNDVLYECHENDIKGKCPNGKCPSYEIYDILEGKWPS